MPTFVVVTLFLTFLVLLSWVFSLLVGRLDPEPAEPAEPPGSEEGVAGMLTDPPLGWGGGTGVRAFQR